jgi:hypothetical protein
MNTSKNNSEQPQVVEVDSMDDILGTASSVALSGGDNSKPSVFSKVETDTTFLDTPGEAEGGKTGNDDEDDEAKKLAKAKEISDAEANAESQSDEDKGEANSSESIIDDITGTPGEAEDEDEDEGKKKSKSGRKPAMEETLTKLIANKSIELFSDQQDISSYTNDDMVELIEANMKKQVEATAKSAPLEVFKRLDPKVQDIIAFELNGGKDVASLLKVAAQSQEVKELSLDKEKDQERIVREWLRASNVMNEEEIEEEITSIIDRGDLVKKATQFKPKLDDKQSLIVKKKLDDQEKAKERAEIAQEKWSETIFQNLNKPTLNGIPLSNKIQTMLFHGLTDDTTYQDRNGNPTNALVHHIEEYQYGENADPSVLLEALWLMANPAEYRQHVLSLGHKETATETFRELKTAEGERKSSSQKQGENRSAPSRSAGTKRTSPRKIFDR